MMMARREELLGLVARVRRRWRARVALQGLGIVVAIGLGLLVAGAGLISVIRPGPTTVLVLRLLAWLGLGAALVRFLLLPLLRRVTDEQVALYIEEHDRSLEAGLVSAVEQAHVAPETPSALTDRLVVSAIAALASLDQGRAVEQARLRRASTTILGTAVATMLLVGLGPAVLRQAGRLLFVPWSAAAAEPAYAVAVEPGDVTIPRGGDVEISAHLRGFTADRVDLLFREGETGEWERVALGSPDSTGAYTFRFFDVTEPIQYTVEANGVRSPAHTISVSDLPTVGRLVVELRYPAYTGLPVERIEPGGDLVVPRGTTVRFLVEPTRPTAEGRVLLEPGQPVPLAPGADSLLEGSTRITGPGSYRIELRAMNGAWVGGSLSYRIDLLEDRGPSVRISQPGRDLQATAIEELFLEASASDDYGIASLELVYRVNGGPEETVPLYRPEGRSRREVSAGHTLFLEEIPLLPGDVIAYYAQARDAAASGSGRTARSDIYFVKIRPFGKEYRQAEQRGAPSSMMGGAGDSPQGLSEQQRQIVAGTFRVLRDQQEGDGATVREDLATLALGQGRLRERLDGLVAQLRQRNAGAVDSGFAIIQVELTAAMPEMQLAEEQLGRRQPDSALAPEQRALQHLQRAEETFREVQVSMEQGGGGGGSMGGNQNASELADLFELETDKLQNQYESVQRARQQQAQAEVDEVLERLKQLASRQQQEDERMRRAAQQLQQRAGSSAASGTAGSAGQRRLAQEAEELARQLERLEREAPSREVAEAARSLAEAAEAMRRSAAASGSAQSAAAQDRLRRAAQALEDARSSRQRGSLGEAGERAAELADRQREIAEDAVRAARGTPSPETVRSLGGRKDSLAADVGRLERDLDDLARELRRSEPASSRQLEEAARGLREGRVGDRIRFSKGLVREGAGEYARNFEEQITGQLEAARERIGAAGGALGVDSARAGREAVARAGDLVRGLESLGDRLQQSTEARGSQTGGGGRPRLVGPTEARQFGRELRARGQGLDSLQAAVRALGLDAGDLEAIGSAIESLGRGDAFATPEGMEKLQTAVLERLKAFEFALRRRLAGDEVDRPLMMPLDDLPPAFREMVAEYYRSLARREKR